MDQNKKQGGQGNRSQGGNQGSQQAGQQDWNQSQNPSRDQPEGPREEMPEPQKPQAPPERGRRIQRDRNSSSGGGISNRGMDSEEEQEDLPDRGSDRQSER